MSGDTRHPVDLDALADYTAGVLDGAEAARVADLIQADAGWARAYEALVRAESAVRDDLRGAAAVSDRMPDDITARIEAVLATLPERGAAVVPLDAARARRRRIATAIAGVAAAGVAVLGGLSLANSPMLSGMQTADMPALAPEASGPAPPPLMSDEDGFGDVGSTAGDSSAWPLVIASGHDYTAGSVHELRAYAGVTPPAEIAKTFRPDMADAPRASADGALARLAAPAAFEACLAAINAIQPGRPVVVDFASYEGSPALVALVQQAASSIVVIVGPDCGISDADMITTAPA